MYSVLCVLQVNNIYIIPILVIYQFDISINHEWNVFLKMQLASDEMSLCICFGIFEKHTLCVNWIEIKMNCGWLSYCKYWYAPSNRTNYSFVSFIRENIVVYRYIILSKQNDCFSWIYLACCTLQQEIHSKRK